MADEKQPKEHPTQQERPGDLSEGQYGGLKGFGPGGGREIEEADLSTPDAEILGREERVRRRAHAIWEREGRPDGREAEHWQMASAEIDAEDG